MPRILIVEDNEENRDALSRRLKRRGFDIVIAVGRGEQDDVGTEGASELDAHVPEAAEAADPDPHPGADLPVVVGLVQVRVTDPAVQDVDGHVGREWRPPLDGERGERAGADQGGVSLGGHGKLSQRGDGKGTPSEQKPCRGRHGNSGKDFPCTVHKTLDINGVRRRAGAGATGRRSRLRRSSGRWRGPGGRRPFP